MAPNTDIVAMNDPISVAPVTLGHEFPFSRTATRTCSPKVLVISM